MGEADERALFEKTAYLFEKSVAVDLLREFAHKRGSADIKTYMTTIRNTFLPLSKVYYPTQRSPLCYSNRQRSSY